MMNVEEMIADYLFRSGFGGLYNENGGCCCEKTDLFPCGCVSGSCKAGYRVVCESGCGDYDFCITEERRRGCVRDERQYEHD